MPMPRVAPLPLAVVTVALIGVAVAAVVLLRPGDDTPATDPDDDSSEQPKVTPPGPQPRQPGEPVRWLNDLSIARDEARRLERLVLVWVTAVGIPAVERIETEIWPDGAAADALHDAFIPVALSQRAHRQDLEAMGALGTLPRLVVLSADGRVLCRNVPAFNVPGDAVGWATSVSNLITEAARLESLLADAAPDPAADPEGATTHAATTRELARHYRILGRPLEARALLLPAAQTLDAVSPGGGNELRLLAARMAVAAHQPEPAIAELRALLATLDPEADETLHAQATRLLRELRRNAD